MQKLKNKRISSKKGFTLVEMIISLAIISILMMGMLTFFGPVTTMISDLNIENHAQTAIVNINTYITKSIIDAKKVAIYQNYSYSDLGEQYKACLSGSGVPYSATGDDVKCLRLAWTKRTGTSYGYILIEEEVDVSNGISEIKLTNTKDYMSESVPDSKKVFKDGYYKGLNFTLAFSYINKEVEDPETGVISTVSLKDGCAISAVPFTDATYKEPINLGDNTRDYFIFNTMRVNKKEDFELYNATIDDDSKDIFIFYIIEKPTP